MSKGSRPRPFSITQEELATRHDAIFGTKPPKERWVPPPIPEELKKQSSFEKQLGKDIPQGRI